MAQVQWGDPKTVLLDPQPSFVALFLVTLGGHGGPPIPQLIENTSKSHRASLIFSGMNPQLLSSYSLLFPATVVESCEVAGFSGHKQLDCCSFT